MLPPKMSAVPMPGHLTGVRAGDVAAQRVGEREEGGLAGRVTTLYPGLNPWRRGHCREWGSCCPHGR